MTTGSGAAELLRSAAREVTDDEVAAYREQGWALLPGFVASEAVSVVGRRLRAALGESGVEGRARAAPEGQVRPDYYDTLFRNWLQPWLEETDLAAFATSPRMGAAAARLMGTRHGVRLWMDEGLVKLPASGGGGRTPWHQDGPTFSFDRCGWLTFWIALGDVPPEMGSLRFYSGSHRSGFHGRVLTTDGADVFTDRPELQGQFPLSPPLTLRPGDATVHDGATIHGAPVNQSDRPRWSYSCAYFPADARYTGATQRLTDGLGLQPGARFDHPNFPLVHEPGPR